MLWHCLREIAGAEEESGYFYKIDGSLERILKKAAQQVQEQIGFSAAFGEKRHFGFGRDKWIQ